MDQVALGVRGDSQRPAADMVMRKVLRIPDQRAIDESATHRIFSTSIFISALRCLLSYIVFPIVLPAIGAASSVGPYIGIPVGVLALTFDFLGIRRFWLADHHRRWMFTAIYLVVGTMVASLLIDDLVRVLS